jgi:ribonucleoside-diphosphate reductase beta chain
LKSNITAPEIAICMTEQASQEAMHNQSYQVLIESIIPTEERNDVYYFWKSDKELLNRCSYIAGLYQAYLDDSTQENYFIALVADYILEGIYFYNGFTFFYNLASRQLMSGSSDMLRLINRDELSHVRLYQKLVKEGLTNFPCSTEQIYQLFSNAVQQEVNWTNHIVGNNILGITEQSTEQYTKYLANTRLKAIGLNPIYSAEEAKNPYKHLDRFSDTEGEGHTKANFFEAGVTSYNMSSAIAGWDEI